MDSRFKGILIHWLGVALGVCVMAMAGLAVIQVILRYIFASGLIWVEEVSIILMLWMTWLGTTLLWLSRGHIAVDFLTGKLNRSANRILSLIIDGIAVILAGALLWTSKETLNTMIGMELDTLPIDLALKYYPIPVGAVALGVAALLDLWARFQKRELDL